MAMKPQDRMKTRERGPNSFKRNRGGSWRGYVDGSLHTWEVQGVRMGVFKQRGLYASVPGSTVEESPRIYRLGLWGGENWE